MPLKKITNLVFKNFQIFLHIWIRRGKGFSKMFISSYFAHFLFLHIFCLITCIKFLKFAIFLKIIKVIEPKGFPNVEDLYHNKEIEPGGRGRTILGKPDVSLNRVKLKFVLFKWDFFCKIKIHIIVKAERKVAFVIFLLKVS